MFFANPFGCYLFFGKSEKNKLKLLKSYSSIHKIKTLILITLTFSVQVIAPILPWSLSYSNYRRTMCFQMPSKEPLCYCSRAKKKRLDLYFNFFMIIFSLNPLITDKFRINATFRQQTAFFGHFRPNFLPILKKVLSSLDSGRFFRFQDVF